MLKNKFKILCKNFSNNSEVIENLWLEIYKKHTKTDRHYHTLEHLEAIYKEFETLEPTTIMEFAIFYHDIVYDVLKNDNEEKSAELAKNQLSILGVKKETIEKVYKLIIETKTHQSSTTKNELFLDADIAILGCSKKNYKNYTSQIREEYAVYNDATYNKGRKKILNSFLEKDTIYKSEHFHNKYEKQAKENMFIEYNSLI